VPPPIPAPPAKKRKWGAKAPQNTSARRVPRSTSFRGRRRGTVEAMADRVILDVEIGGLQRAPAHD
jgi:hypothetical protein